MKKLMTRAFPPTLHPMPSLTFGNERLCALLLRPIRRISLAFGIDSAHHLRTDGQQAVVVSQRETTPSPPRSRQLSEPSQRDLHRVVNGRIAKKWNGRTRPTTSRGLKNSKESKDSKNINSCYRNAMLQCLAHLPELYAYLDSVRTTCQSAHCGCAACALKTLFRAYWTPKVSRLGLDQLDTAQFALNRVVYKTVPKHDPMWDDIRASRQSDPFDFLQYVVRELTSKELPGHMHLHDLFATEHKPQWTCADCGHTVARPETTGESGHGLGLKLNIQEPTTGLTLTEYLRANEYEEILKIRCETESCTTKHGHLAVPLTRTRRRLITRSPEILVIRLLRYRQVWDKATGESKDSKNKDDVDLEEYLNLGEFTANEEPLLYRLMGVVAHDGENIHSGHYIASVRCFDGKTFCTLDDSKLKRDQRGTVWELETPVSGDVDFDPCILIYSKL